MNIFETITQSEIVSIEGENKSGKLTFTLYLLSRSAKEKTLILSSIPKPILKKRLQSIKNLKDGPINSLLENTDYLCLKENWEEIKAKYGFDFLIEDIARIIQDVKPKNIIIHRADLMFNEDEYEFAKWFTDSLIELKEENGLRLFFTTKENTVIQNITENYSDIDFEIKNVHQRTIKVKSSLFPLKTLSFIFTYEFGKLVLKETKNSSLTPNESKKHSMLLITQNEYLTKVHKYLFEKKFEISHANDIAQSVANILKEPDIVVFNPQEKSLNLQICQLASEKKLLSKIIYLVNKDYVRTDDKMKAVYAGCYDIMPANFTIEEYIFLIEKLIKDFFYTEKINQLPLQKETKNFDHFCKIVDNFYKERIYFTVFAGECDDGNILKHIRIHDIIYKSHNTTYICFVNTNAHTFETGIKHKINPRNYSLIEAVDWKEKGICK